MSCGVSMHTSALPAVAQTPGDSRATGASSDSGAASASVYPSLAGLPVHPSPHAFASGHPRFAGTAADPFTPSASFDPRASGVPYNPSSDAGVAGHPWSSRPSSLTLAAAHTLSPCMSPRRACGVVH